MCVLRDAPRVSGVTDVQCSRVHPAAPPPFSPA